MKLYNSLTLKKEEFKPIEEGKVKFYSCGPTVYNYFHIGNARPFIVFDALRRYFEYKGYEVAFAQNFTDVDDKIINKAKDEGVEPADVSEKYIKEYYKDAKALSIKEATYHPKATDEIPYIINIVKTLVDKDYAYEVNGDVYFRVRKFEGYGKLAHQSIDDLEEGARIAVGEVKEDPLDFALWKARKEDSEIAWESPWGMGRPGWHIECSSMAKHYLGETIDIHSGGKDLIFPHHQNEVAQSECANGCTFANYWLHNGHINVDNQKMSKSLGNFWTVRDILKKYPGEVLRFFILSVHYRSPMNFSFDILGSSKSGLERIKECYNKLEKLGELDTDVLKDFTDSLDDDFNIPKAIAVIFDYVKFCNTNPAKASKATLKEMLTVLGFDFDKAVGFTMEEKVLLKMREDARANKDWTASDELRDKLAELGIIVKDTKDGQNASRI